MFKSFQSNISSNYTIAPKPTCTTGAWQVFAATHKKSGKAVSVFAFDRKTLEIGGLEARSSSSSAVKKIHSEVIERLKKEASSLARLRHPSVLELAEPVEETRTGLMFATEPVAATLNGLLADKDEEERAGSRPRRGNGADASAVELDELEIQKGLQQIAKGLEFLHESAGLVHGNLTPDAIYVNGKSDWKIAALGFSGPPDTGAKPGAGAPIALSELLYNDPRLPPAVQLNMDYTSPDFVIDSSVTSSADMFSLGLIVIALYNSPHRSPVRTHGNTSTYKKMFSSVSTVPTASNNFLSSKPLPQQFLDTLPAKTPNEKSQFMRGLPRILDQFPRSVLEKKLLPGLLEETKDRDLLALILGNVFKILQLLKGDGQRSFTDRVVPKLREVFLSGNKNDRDTLKEAGLVIILDNMSLVAENCDGKVFKDDILPIYVSGLESQTSAVVDKTLDCLSIVLPKLDFSTIKNELFPVIAAVFAKTKSLAIKVRGLDALSTLCGGKSDPTTAKTNSSILDKYTVQEKVVPLVKAIRTKEPAVMMASLALFTSISNICDYDFLATSVLPIIWSFSLGPLLNLEQFNKYMDLIKSMSQRIQQEHTRKLRELATTSGDHSNGNGTSDPSDLMGTSGADDIFSTGAGQDDFTSLVLGKKAASPTSADPWSLPSRPSAQATPTLSTFSQTTASSSSMPWSNSNLQTSQISSRAITPDSMLGSIASLQPSQPSQPQRPAIGMQAMQPSNPWSTPASPPVMSPGAGTGSNSAGSGAIDWTKARQAQLPTNLQATSFMASAPQIQQSRPPQQQQQQFGGGFNLQPPPGANQQRFQQQQQPPPQQPRQPQQTQQWQQPQPQKKQGLDQYESLI